MPAENIDDDLKPIFQEARLLAIAWKHGFINYDHLFVVMLKTQCAATPYLGPFDVEEWEQKIKDLYGSDRKAKLRGSIPLTVIAERVVKHSFFIADLFNDGPPNTLHVLLAIMSFQNQVTSAFDKAGILTEDITMAHYGREIKRLPAILDNMRDKPFSRSEKFFMGRGGRRKQVEALRTNAVNLYLYKQYGQSITDCQVGLSLEPENVRLRTMLVYNYLALGDYEAAAKILNELIKSNPGNDISCLMLSTAYHQTGKHEQATQLLDELLTKHPENPLYLNNKGFNLQRQGRHAESVPYFEKAIKADPSYAYSFNNLGFAKYKLGDTGAAIALIDHSLTLDKGNSYAYKNKGIIAKEQGDKSEALKNFKLAVKYGYVEKYGDEVTALMKECEELP